MTKTFALLAAASAIALSAPAFAADKATYESKTKIEQDADGSYDKKVTQEQKDASGKTSSEVKTSVDVDSDGEVEKTVKTEQVNDPKGLMNKTKTKTEDTVKHQADGKVSTHHKKVVNGKTVENTKEEGHAPAAH